MSNPAPSFRVRRRPLWLALAFALAALSSPSLASTTIVVQLTTGGDDLRGGNAAYLRLVRRDGTVTSEQLLSNGEAGGARSTHQLTFPETLAAHELGSARLRHDGNPRSGHPFDTYDNWNLAAITIELLEGACPNARHTLVHSSSDATFRGVRFTGALRQLDLIIREILPPTWCTHATAQLFHGDLDGDGQIDALCHDRVSGAKVYARRQGASLLPAGSNLASRWCTHDRAHLGLGDVNRDGRADLICVDPTTLWVDGNVGADRGYFLGTPTPHDVVPISWCAPEDAFLVGDQNRDGRADVVCRQRDGLARVDYADASGRFDGIADVARVAPDFEIVNITRTESSYLLDIRNHGATGIVTSFSCTPVGLPPVLYSGSLSIPAGATRRHSVRRGPGDRCAVTCAVWGSRAANEVIVSNNRRTQSFP